MKPLLTLTLAFLLALTWISCKKENGGNTKSLIQSSLSTPLRYRDSVFASVDTTSFFNVFYRTAQNFDIVEDLKLDAYLPKNDTAHLRAAVIFIHGGAFDRSLNGTRKAEMANCIDYAKRGFVAISISYRRGKDFKSGQSHTDSVGKVYDAIYRAAQDARAALRFIKKNAASAKIDTNRIFIGGVSAGAATAMNVVYLDPIEIAPNFQQFGPLDGVGAYDYPGFSLKVKGVINLAAAIYDKNYIQISDEPMISFFGTDDGYYKDFFTIPSRNYPSFTFDNGKKIKLRMDQLGIVSQLDTIIGKDHAGFLGDTKLVKNAVNTSANWMYNLMQ